MAESSIVTPQDCRPRIADEGGIQHPSKHHEQAADNKNYKSDFANLHPPAKSSTRHHTV